MPRNTTRGARKVVETKISAVASILSSDLTPAFSGASEITTAPAPNKSKPVLLIKPVTRLEYSIMVNADHSSDHLYRTAACPR